jgi:2-polyprenyl-3-methyl-5-hydroxy-6-metoxy-1,4-benzoquinol methylase
MDDVERQAMFCIADISGYTKFIFSNEKEISHSQMVIRELITTLVEEVGHPLQMIRIEGDAIFLYAFQDDPEQSWDSASKKVLVNLKGFFQVFANKLSELTIHKVCHCTACINIEQLKLKIVVHSGRAAFYRVNEHQELTGTAPIIIHRLLKNSVQADEYMLLTEAAYNDLNLPGEQVEPGVETYEDIGSIDTYVYYPPAPGPYVPAPDAKPPTIFVETLRAEVCKEYAQVAINPALGFHFHTGRPLASLLEYRDKWLEGLPDEAIESFAGTGNPFQMGELHSDDRVVDAGCGAGLDCLISARMVGSEGEVIGVDMTEEMVDKATRNAQSIRANNVSIKLGVLEDLPVEDGWADVLISNGSINLAPDKDAVFRELYRVLKPGGRLQVADILVERPIPESAKRNIDLWTG